MSFLEEGTYYSQDIQVDVNDNKCYLLYLALQMLISNILNVFYYFKIKSAFTFLQKRIPSLYIFVYFRYSSNQRKNSLWNSIPF